MKEKLIEKEKRLNVGGIQSFLFKNKLNIKR
jgi:hypothetical protein